MSKLLIENMPPLGSQHTVVCKPNALSAPRIVSAPWPVSATLPIPHWRCSQTQRGSATPRVPPSASVGGHVLSADLPLSAERPCIFRFLKVTCRGCPTGLENSLALETHPNYGFDPSPG